MKILKVKDVKTPSRGTCKSAGIDFYVPNDFDKCYLKPHNSVLIDSGIKLRVPEGKVLIFFNKSGIAVKKDLKLGACVIDEDYQGEVKIHLTNTGESNVWIEPGDKIVQGLLVDADYSGIEEVADIDDLFGNDISDRGEGCLGSTGVK